MSTETIQQITYLRNQHNKLQQSLLQIRQELEAIFAADEANNEEEDEN